MISNALERPSVPSETPGLFHLFFSQDGLTSEFDAVLSGLGDTVHLTLLADVILELSEDSQHAEEGPSCCVSCIDALVQHPERYTLLIKLPSDRKKVLR